MRKWEPSLRNIEMFALGVAIIFGAISVFFFHRSMQ